MVTHSRSTRIVGHRNATVPRGRDHSLDNASPEQRVVSVGQSLEKGNGKERKRRGGLGQGAIVETDSVPPHGFNAREHGAGTEEVRILSDGRLSSPSRVSCVSHIHMPNHCTHQTTSDKRGSLPTFDRPSRPGREAHPCGDLPQLSRPASGRQPTLDLGNSDDLVTVGCRTAARWHIYTFNHPTFRHNLPNKHRASNRRNISTNHRLNRHANLTVPPPTHQPTPCLNHKPPWPPTPPTSTSS